MGAGVVERRSERPTEGGGAQRGMWRLEAGRSGDEAETRDLKFVRGIVNLNSFNSVADSVRTRRAAKKGTSEGISEFEIEPAPATTGPGLDRSPHSLVRRRPSAARPAPSHCQGTNIGLELTGMGSLYPTATATQPAVPSSTSANHLTLIHIHIGRGSKLLPSLCALEIVASPRPPSRVSKVQTMLGEDSAHRSHRAASALIAHDQPTPLLTFINAERRAPNSCLLSAADHADAIDLRPSKSHRHPNILLSPFFALPALVTSATYLERSISAFVLRGPKTGRTRVSRMDFMDRRSTTNSWYRSLEDSLKHPTPSMNLYPNIIVRRGTYNRYRSGMRVQAS